MDPTQNSNPWAMLASSPDALRKLASMGQMALNSGLISPDEAKGHLTDAMSQLGMTGDTTSNAIASTAYAPKLSNMGDGKYGGSDFSWKTPGDIRGTKGHELNTFDKEMEIQVSPQPSPSPTAFLPQPAPPSPVSMAQTPILPQPQTSPSPIAMADPGNREPGATNIFMPPQPKSLRYVGKTPAQYRADMKLAQGIDPATGVVDQNDPMVKQQNGLDSLNDLIQRQGARIGKMDTMDWTPLLGAADAENAKHGTRTFLANAYNPPKDQTNQYLQNVMALQKQQAGLQNLVNKNQQAMKGGTGYDTTGGNTNTAQDRMDLTNHMKIIASIKNDPVLRQSVQTANRIANALTMYKDADVHTPQNFAELQVALRSAIGMGSTIGAERAETYFNSLGLEGKKLSQWINNDVSNMSPKDPFFNHVAQTADLESNNIRKQAMARLNVTSSGLARGLYARRPDLYQDMQDTANAVGAQFAPPQPDNLKAAPTPQNIPTPIPQASPSARPNFKTMSDSDLVKWIEDARTERQAQDQAASQGR